MLSTAGENTVTIDFWAFLPSHSQTLTYGSLYHRCLFQTLVHFSFVYHKILISATFHLTRSRTCQLTITTLFNKCPVSFPKRTRTVTVKFGYYSTNILTLLLYLEHRVLKQKNILLYANQRRAKQNNRTALWVWNGPIGFDKKLHMRALCYVHM